MQLVHHGGKCCGMKTIFNLGMYPEQSSSYNISEYHYTDYEKEASNKPSYFNNDVTYDHVSCDQGLFYEAAPKETKGERLKRIVDFVGKNRSHHCVEVILQLNGAGSQSAWKPYLIEMGFRPGPEWYNSNSGNRCQVFHVILEEGKIVKE